MTMKLHSQFTRDIIGLSTGPAQMIGVNDVIRLSAMGILPEAWDPAVPLAMPQPFPDSDGAQATLATSSAVSKYSLSNASKANLSGVIHPLADCVMGAILITIQDFCVYEGLRTLAQQHKNVQRGVSQTMDSMHLPQSDGFGHAVDLVPWIGGKPTWDWGGCYRVAMAMDEAATQLGIAEHIRWGGAWDKRLSDFGGDEASYKQAVQDYQKRHPGPDFLDGPHFEWRA